MQWWLHYENKNIYYENKYSQVFRESGEDISNPNQHFKIMKIIALNKIPWVFKISVIFQRYLLIPWVFQVFQARLNPVMHCLIWYRLYNLKNEKNTHVGMLHSLKCNTNGTKWREVSHIHTTDLCIIMNMIKLLLLLLFLPSSFING